MGELLRTGKDLLWILLMTDPKMIVRDINGGLLFDTRNITYGLVKSGYMSLIEYWSRRFFRGGNVDPNWGSNWSESVVTYAPANNNDAIHGFTVANARSPIAFITGGGSLQTIRRNPDGSATFLYTGASNASKFYCYDLMSNFMPGGPFLKTYKEDGTITFNSLQPPLNILTTVPAPAPGGVMTDPGRLGATYFPYDGGYGVWVRTPREGVGTYRFYIDLALNIGGECAVHLPWTRGAQARADWLNSNNKTFFGVSEGAFGGVNKISFSFVEAGGTPSEQSSDATRIPGTYYWQLPATPRPTAMVVSTFNLPFPFN